MSNIRILIIFSFLFFGGIHFSYAQDLVLDNTNTQNKDVLYNTTTQKVFNQAQKSVYQIRVINKKSGQKSSIGSGFRVHPHGFFVTNYHVISEVVLEPDDYSLEYLGHANNRAVLKIRNIDVVNDLAVLEPVEKEDGLSKRYLNISGKAMDQGAPIFSIGNPHDLGMTIINGVYNGLLEKSFYKKILFSGALNPGMSGGPALNVDGKVIGVNVATSGDDLGYLVPAKFVRALLDGEPPEVEWKNVVRDQLLNNSKKVILGLLSKPWETKNFGEFQIPENLDAAFKCWGAGHSESEEKNYSYAQMVCSTQDNLYISSSIDTGKIRFSALKIDSVAMNRFAFSQFYKSNYESVSGNVSDKSIEDVKEFSCQNTFALIAKKKWKVAICARPYKKFSGLYDIFVKAALMGRGQEGYVLDIFMDGFAESSGQDFAEKFLETMQ